MLGGLNERKPGPVGIVSIKEGRIVGMEEREMQYLVVFEGALEGSFGEPEGSKWARRSVTGQMKVMLGNSVV